MGVPELHRRAGSSELPWEPHFHPSLEQMCRGTESDMAQALIGVPVPSEGLVQGKGHPEPHGCSQEKLSQQV